MRVAVVGFGNIGRSVIEAIEAAPDMEFAGLIRRDRYMAVASPSGVALVAMITSLIDGFCCNRLMRLVMFRSSGPLPSIGDITPCKT